MNLGKVELDGILSVDGELRQEKVYEAFKEYLNVQKAMAASLGEYHPVRHRPSLAGGGRGGTLQGSRKYVMKLQIDREKR